MMNPDCLHHSSFLILMDFAESEIGPETVRALERIDRIDRIFQDLQDVMQIPHPVNPEKSCQSCRFLLLTTKSV
ncbi:MAG: hypothetical protein SF339_23775, partial [Blastocatellia bacterium]|nr:hypothetical protein [Blastocatellia bacterium]